MNVLKTLINIILIYSFISIFLQLIFKFFSRRIKNIISGCYIGIVAILSMLIGNYLFNQHYSDGKFFLIFMSGILFGPLASASTGLLVLIAGLLTGKYFSVILTLQIVSTLIISILGSMIVTQRGIKYIRTNLHFFCIVLLFINVLWGFAFKSVYEIHAALNISTILSAAMMPFLGYIIINLFLSEREKNINNHKLLSIEKELYNQNQELILANTKLINLAYTDMLTGLPNRKFLYDEFEEIDKASKYSGGLRSIIYLDLDNFKNTNDTMGHSVGDSLLDDLGKRLLTLNNDFKIIARIGGDEFILMTIDENEEAILEKAKKVLKLFERPFVTKDIDTTITASIGIAIYPKDGKNFENLLKNADTAMYKAKEKGKNCIVFYKASMNKDAWEKVNLESSLRRALSNNELQVHYQPQYNTNKEIIGFEALVRWFSEKHGYVSPDKFIPIAEENGLIHTLGEWVFKEACIFSKRINNLRAVKIVVSINISPLQLTRFDFIETITKILNDTGAKPEEIGIEITETSLMQSFETAVEKITHFKNKGMLVSLDDFGTGYSSLNYLSVIPANTVKIDKSFTMNLLKDERLKKLTETVINLSHYLNMQVVSEGVETIEQYELLNEMGCDYFQGFLFSRPIDVMAAESLLL